MNLFAIFLGCFLFFCAPANRHVAPKRGNECALITSMYAKKTGSRDDFVKLFPPAKQHRVLECIGDEQ